MEALFVKKKEKALKTVLVRKGEIKPRETVFYKNRKILGEWPREKMMDFIRAKNLKHEYIRIDEEGEQESVTEALRGVDLTVRQGEFVAVLGHNGSGKSTFAKHLNVLLSPSDGELWIDGKDARLEEYLWEIRRLAGMVFQNPDNQIIASVVEEDVGFGPENMGVPTEEIHCRVSQSLKNVGMSKYRKESPNRLSGGQKQRVAIAGVLAMEPKCIILDEPTAMLDPNGRKEVLAAVKKLNQEKGITIVWITHYMEEVVEADRVYVMDRGQVVLTGIPREIFSRVEELSRYRLDVPQVTLLAHELRKEGLQVPAGILTREELVDCLCQLYWNR